MSLVDLQSDLSKFRSTAVKQEKTTPASSKAKDGNNFANILPVSDNLESMSPNVNPLEQSNLAGMMSSTKLDDIKKFKTKPLSDSLGNSKLDDIKTFSTNPIESKLEGTKLDDINKFNTIPIEKRLETSKLDDIVKKVFEEGLVNSVSKYSAINTNFETTPISNISTENVISELGNVRRELFSSKLNKSETEVGSVAIGQNNLKSDVDVSDSQLTFDRKNSTPNINTALNNQTNNITDPKVPITPSELFTDRTII